MSSASGTLLGERYRVADSLGSGGMGAVWRARDELLGRDVAVKELVFPPNLSALDKETMRGRMMREARTAARLSHPGVVRIFDVVEAEERPWIVMELIPSARSLNGILDEEGPFAPADAARIGLEVLAALSAAHAAGVLHRDVKPGNILIAPDGRVVLGDFGIAVAEGEPTLTRSGVLIGSPAYLSPEQARGRPLTPASDLWSLGATLYTAVEGETPFHRDNVMATLTAILTDPPNPPRRAGALWPVIEGLLRKDPADRLDAVALARALTEVTAREEIGAADPETRARAADPPPAPYKMPVGRPAEDERPRDAAPVRPRGGTPGAEPPREDTEPPRGTGLLPARPAHRWGRAAAVVSIVLLLGAAGALTVLLNRSHHHAAGLTGTSGKGTGRSASPLTTPSARSSASASPSRSRGTTAASPSPGGTALPADFRRYEDDSGFSIGVPRGWKVSHDGGYVYVRDPGSSRYLLIDQTTHPKSDPLADWRQQDAYRRGSDAGYTRIRLESVHGYFEKAADLEFLHTSGGEKTHVLNRNILVNGHRAYALYWSTPASQWSRSRRYFDVFAASFQPAS
ncbi:serine/threonine-protein kinase [Actinoallomurus rhizosphaericola]|uniref:serine/threonine-protein kinase n=1 Tax=Actinoallomurus rhizosphaericola TaxID=2952536 RepID=UPI002093450D|nr:serine/threonine-protein kinase [Actinoallomurus rhizosphaericola]MCO5995250.1 serine/threonine protein kinase [Actinoallomurus rhizosphaericola]